MRKPVVLLPEARDEAIAAREWYAEQAPHVVSSFVDELRSAFDAVGEKPAFHGILELPFRAAQLRRFPYYVVFRELDDVIEIVAVRHAARRPDYWRRRMED